MCEKDREKRSGVYWQEALEDVRTDDVRLGIFCRDSDLSCREDETRIVDIFER